MLEKRVEPFSNHPPAFLIATGLYVFLTIHGALGILRFGHPQLCLNRAFRKIYEVSFSLIRIVPCILITTQIYGFYWRHLDQLELTRNGVLSDLLFRYNLNIFLAGCLALALLNELWSSLDSVKLLIIVANVFLLALIGAQDECYWTIFLAVQVLFCNFGLQELSGRFEMSFLEIFMIGMCFFNIFAFRSLGELIEVLQENY